MRKFRMTNDEWAPGLGLYPVPPFVILHSSFAFAP